MKASIEVKNPREGEVIRLAMSRPDVRAFVVTMGVLMTLPTDRARARVLNFVADKFNEEHHDEIVRCRQSWMLPRCD